MAGVKMKTKRAAAKRFSVTGSGRIKRNAAKRRHILSHKSRKLKRHLRQDKYIAAVDERQVRRLIPYL
ncbi:MAG: 50S ribosomal protein L35 [Pseudomonadota bacterium]